MPDYGRCVTVDELHERNADLVNEYSGRVELIDLGESTDGEMIDCLKFGDGRHNALIHVFPNFEEPFSGNSWTTWRRRCSTAPFTLKAGSLVPSDLILLTIFSRATGFYF